jgi:hypothetical protein
VWCKVTLLKSLRVFALTRTNELEGLGLGLPRFHGLLT